MTPHTLGAHIQEDGSVFFRVWAPHQPSLSVEVVGKGSFALQKEGSGYFSVNLSGIDPSDSYYYVFENGLKRPDPVSRFLPQSVHGPTQIVDPKSFKWSDKEHRGLDLPSAIFYELHVGTFSKEGSFDGVVSKLPHLKELGVTCLELMPVCQCPGDWNWGYDGVSLFAVEKSFGGPEGLKRLINACHLLGISVCLDVVYNHLGPEGNYLGEFGPYFSDRYHTPWGKGFNYDGPHSDEVRELILQNILYWIDEFHIDALRLDAVHGIFDFSCTHLLSELSEVVHMNRTKQVHLIAESDRNDSFLIRPKSQGGVNLDALWNDDFHHAAHVALTQEQSGYYCDFNGICDLGKAISKGFVYDGQYSSYKKKREGNSPHGVALQKFLVFVQNHDQIGNRADGMRLSQMLDKGSQKNAALLNLLTPSIPMVFMGQEYNESAPFEYFVDFENEHLMQEIYEGRKKEFKREDMPFPGKEAFLRSHLRWDIDLEMMEFYKTVISLRKQYPPKQKLMSEDCFVYTSEEEKWICWEYPSAEGGWIGVLCSLSETERCIPSPFKHVSMSSMVLATEKSCEVREDTIFLSPKSGVVFCNKA